MFNFGKKSKKSDVFDEKSDEMMTLTSSLYKQNVDITSKNKSLSAMKKLYDVSILILKRKDLAEQIVSIIRDELDLELVGILLYDQDKSMFRPLAFTSSQRLTETQSDLKIDFNTMNIELDKSPLVQKVVIGKSGLHDEELSAIWGSSIDRKAYKELHESGHIKTSLVSPLLIENEIMGLSIFATNRAYSQLSDHEIEIISSFSNIIAVAIDRAILYEKLTSVNTQLEEANENQKNLIHFISHQVKGFFTRSINVFSEALSGSYGAISDDLKWLLQKGLESDRKGVDTVQDIFFSADLRKGKAKFDMDSKVNLKEMIEEIYGLEKPTADEKGIELNLSIADSLPTIQGDNEKLKEVFKNLIENAIIYTPKGGVDIKLVEKDGHILFSVKDEGVGLTEEDKAVLFTEGGKGKDSSKVNANTSGYGLYIAKQIVEAHKGKIWAESEGKDKGSTFSVQF